MTEPTLEKVRHIEMLRPQAGDVLMVHLDSGLGSQELETMHQNLKARLPLDVHVVLISGRVRFEVVRADEG